MNDETPKKTRRKRRVPGTDKPPLKVVTLRLEQKTLQRIDALLASYSGSRNNYIEKLIEFDLDYRDRIQPLNTPVTTPPADQP
jgi:hypothetical protein